MAQSKHPGTAFYRSDQPLPPYPTEEDMLEMLEEIRLEMEDEPEGQAQVAAYIQEYREYVDSGRYRTEAPPQKPKVMRERVQRGLEEAREISRLNLEKNPELQAEMAALDLIDDCIPYEDFPNHKYL